jgi:hypothetical protein
MQAESTELAELALSINGAERAELLRLLRQALGSVRIEVHRPHAPEYRARILHQESLFQGLLHKMGEFG